MRDGDDRALVSLQVLLQPRDALGVEVVRRLVQDAGCPASASSSRHSATRRFSPPDSTFDRRVRRRAPQRVHRHLQLLVEVPRPVVSSFSWSSPCFSSSFSISSSSRSARPSFSLICVELLEQLDRRRPRPLRRPGARSCVDRAAAPARGSRPCSPARLAIWPSKFLSTPARMRSSVDLARAVKPEHADLRAVEVREVDVLEDDLLVVALADADHRIDDFVGFIAHDLPKNH